MVSNYFSRPFGLRPTPSTCFPPPPPPPKGQITGTVRLVEATMPPTFDKSLEWTVCNPILAVGEPLTKTINIPHLTEAAPFTIGNCVPGAQLFLSDGTPGTFFGTVQLQWSNGQVRTYPVTYTN